MEHLSVVEWCVLAYVCIAPIVAVVLIGNLFSDIISFSRRLNEFKRKK